MIYRRSSITAFLTAVLMACVCAPASADAPEADGWTYQLHTASPPAKQLDASPWDIEDATISYIAQGPHYTLKWARADHHTLKHARFSQGRRNMGLFVPRWPPGKSADDAQGWASYGHAITYRSFSVSVERGKHDRKIDGRQTRHYILTADFANRDDRDMDGVFSQVHITTDLWVYPDAPFSWVPFDTAGVYGDPRLDAAMLDKLSDLGLVMRAETRYSNQTIKADGSKLDYHNDGTFLTWVSGLKAATVPAPDMPVVAKDRVKKLQTEFRKDRAGACKTMLAGKVPGFVSDALDGDAAQVFVTNMSAACKRHMQRKH